jgi:glycosyltransferase involved in cell wall biosynthesis
MVSKITTIIPTFQRPALLKRALLSVLSQTYTNFQVHVCDNASCDETEEIMQEFVSQDSRIKYHKHMKNIGMMGNYEFGFSLVTTPYFSFLSDDDHLSPWFYETALKDLEQFPEAAFSICKVFAVNEMDQVIMDSLCLWHKTGYFKAPDRVLEFITPSLRTPLPTCTLFNKSKFDRIKPSWNQEMQHLWDHDCFLQLAARFPFIINEKACGFFMSHESGFSSGFFAKLRNHPETLDSYLKAFDLLISRVLNNKYLPLSIRESAYELLVKSCKELVQHYAGIQIDEKTALISSLIIKSKNSGLARKLLQRCRRLFQTLP